MLLVGLTGGIGSGKSTVARMLESKDAVVFDADLLARDAIRPGTPGHDRVAERFGANILAPGGDIDREALASIVFADPSARRDLEAIVHPEVWRLFWERVESHRETDRVVVFNAPLLVETGTHTLFQVLVVVRAPLDARAARLVSGSGMSDHDIRRRAAAQASDEERAAVADVLLDNEGTIQELQAQVDRLWGDLQARVNRRAG